MPGLGLILPSFEALFAPHAFQGAFAQFFSLMTPALFAFGMLNYGVNPAFQLAHRLTPLVVAALVAVLANFVTLAFPPAPPDAARFALAQSVSSMTGLLTLVALALLLEFPRPRARDILGALAATGAMVASGLPLRMLPPGALTLALQLAAGAGLYGALAVAFDIAGFRGMIAETRSRRC